jgi:hypothetical protein
MGQIHPLKDNSTTHSLEHQREVYWIEDKDHEIAFFEKKMLGWV